MLMGYLSMDSNTTSSGWLSQLHTQFLEKSYALARRFLIVQTVVSLANDAEDFFECPAPGWTWGNRYSRRSFDCMIRGKGWNIVHAHFNELEGNQRPEDRGSLYYLVKK